MRIIEPSSGLHTGPPKTSPVSESTAQMLLELSAVATALWILFQRPTTFSVKNTES